LLKAKKLHHNTKFESNKVLGIVAS